MLRQLLSSAVDLVYPARCVGCGAFNHILCPDCETAMIPATGPGRCLFCSAEWDESSTNCPRCFHMQSLDGVRATFEMSGPARGLVHELKYRYVRAAAPVMAHHMRALSDETPFDIALAVPLHPSRYRHRGFNQAGEILHALEWPVAPGRLHRVRRTERQVGMDMSERRSNVAGAFAYRGDPLDGLTVAVIDDVVTTGATANTCAQVLRDHGARHVYALAFARKSYDPTTTFPIND